MLIIEYIILIAAYTSLTISLFLQWLCYKKKMENIETLAFTGSLLLLVISFSVSPLLAAQKTTNLFTLLCMILVSVTTFLDTLSLQKHTISVDYKNAYLLTSLLLAVSVIMTKFFWNMLLVQYVVVSFLSLSVVISMLIINYTKPKRQFQHLEKSNNIFALIFLILVPAYLIFHYGFVKVYQQLQIGFLLYIVFIALAIRKIYDDLCRLSLVKNNIKPGKQNFKNYGLTEREQQIAELLFQGFTYKNIADQLFISLPTVKTHVSNIYKKCKVKTRNELTYILSS